MEDLDLAIIFSVLHRYLGLPAVSAVADKAEINAVEPSQGYDQVSLWHLHQQKRSFWKWSLYPTQMESGRTHSFVRRTVAKPLR